MTDKANTKCPLAILRRGHKNAKFEASWTECSRLCYSLHKVRDRSTDISTDRRVQKGQGIIMEYWSRDDNDVRVIE